MKTTISFPIDTDRLDSINDEYLATFWHIAQANPAPISDHDAGEFAELVGREIIRRWLKTAPVALWHHQGRHHFWDILQKNGSWLPVNGDENNRQWVTLRKATPKDLGDINRAKGETD